MAKTADPTVPLPNDLRTLYSRCETLPWSDGARADGSWKNHEMTDGADSDSTKPTRLDRAALRARKHDRAAFDALPRTPIALVLDGVVGNYNHGAIFRLCDALMIEKVHFCGATIKPWHRRFLKSARGTYKWVPYSVDEDVTHVLKQYATRGYQVVVAEQCEGSVSICDAKFSSPACIVLGGELTGVSPKVVKMADMVVELPTLGMANSLNVSMSAGMLVLSAYQVWKAQPAGTD